MVTELRDFLQMYNRISETCFTQCISSLLERDVQSDEVACVQRCADKHINSNQKIMQVFMEVQPQVVAKRMEKMEQQMAETQAAESAEAQPQTAEAAEVQPQAAEATEAQPQAAVEAAQAEAVAQ
ncbi:Mitochondrial import inner membrane translocase subunit Tim10B [Amphibalanus amphitrite]|uniref:Mitochondrial import inner membrane translocase subunit n=1 Tax=Amphibalanus amphitrite TaxID=1232801 RepID=A0A6A4XEC1_AMPAM|nr:Mitochondrial import inner membrane translocase subunit Tim10B [Amphibalanus amphitrite]